MRNLYEIFHVKRLMTEDIDRLLWWTRGMRAAYGAHYDPEELPLPGSMNYKEFSDGMGMGSIVRRTRARSEPKTKPK